MDLGKDHAQADHPTRVRGLGRGLLHAPVKPEDLEKSLVQVCPKKSRARRIGLRKCPHIAKSKTGWIYRPRWTSHTNEQTNVQRPS